MYVYKTKTIRVVTYLSSLQKKSMDIHTNCTFNYQYRSSTEILMGFIHLYTYMYIILMKKERKRSCDIDKQDRLRGIAIIKSVFFSNHSYCFCI